MRVGEHGRPTGGLGHRAAIGGDDRAGARHRLEDREAEGLVERGVDQEVRCLIKTGGLLERYAADEDDVVGDAQLADECVQLGRVLVVTLWTDDDELAARKVVTYQPPGPEQGVTVLVAPEGRYEQHEGLRDPERSHVSPGGLAVTGLEGLVVDCFVDQLDLVRVNLQITIDFAAQAVGVDDDRLREPGRALVVRSAIEARAQG